MSERDMSEKGMNEKGMHERGISEKGMHERGISEKDMIEKGMHERGISEKGICIAVEEAVEGIPAVRLENAWLRAVILVGKGTDIWELTYKPLNADVLLKTAAGLAPLRGRDLRQSPLLHYAEPYPGGWQELLPNRARYGAEDIGRDREGESAGLPWRFEIRREERAVVLRCRVTLSRTPLAIEKTFRLTAEAPDLHLEERVVNVGREPVSFIWAHHPAFGGPLVDASARVVLPAGSTAFNLLRYEQDRTLPLSRYEEDPRAVTLPSGRSKDLHRVEARSSGGEGCYVPLKGFEIGEAGIDNPELGLSLRLRWDAETFGCLRYWSRSDDELHTVALEPSSSWFSDLDDCLRHGNSITLQPEERRETWLRIRLDRFGSSPPPEA
ncbi:hypothetical protein [Cohnella nanjingensis]|uniref:DUF4432 family protein n=1 Tax=Cohnella nanjingensis TaxID=1387779 RepID=A0A7X0RQV7_9BACL|nr:hypothetical protein [Cohnella nanjingensis]MBB6670740.1 hypothetical protein [Cohnella nanjingensis]